jgi:hypothetical protein
MAGRTSRHASMTIVNFETTNPDPLSIKEIVA